MLRSEGLNSNWLVFIKHEGAFIAFTTNVYYLQANSRKERVNEWLSQKYNSLILIRYEPENVWVSLPFWTITHAITHAALW